MASLTSVLERARPSAERPVRRPVNPVAAIVALAVGGFAIGTTEFTTMGLLPEIAAGIGTSIPTTGHVISAYALGVFVGAPVIVALAARLPRRGLAVGLVLALGLGNLLTALAPGYGSLMVARFVAGLPHGAYFGVASLIAASLVAPDRRGRAVSSVMLGLAVANVMGVPAATWLGQQLGWRSAYAVVVGLALLTAVLILAFVPHQPRDVRASVRGEIGALRRPQVWLTLGVGTVGFGGMFAMYSYVAPTVTEVAGASSGSVPVVLLMFGIGGVVGTGLGGRFADRALIGSLVGTLVAMGLLLATVPVLATRLSTLAVVVLLVSAVGSALCVCLQVRLMEVAGDAAMLGAALNHSALNAANALGAWLGGVVIAAGLGYTAPSLVGVGLAAAGLVVLTVSVVLQRRTDRDGLATAAG